MSDMNKSLNQIWGELRSLKKGVTTLQVNVGTVAANNGLTYNGYVQLGQSIDKAGNPATLLENREIPLNGFGITLPDVGNDSSIAFAANLISVTLGATKDISLSTGGLRSQVLITDTGTNSPQLVLISTSVTGSLWIDPNGTSTPIISFVNNNLFGVSVHATSNNVIVGASNTADVTTAQLQVSSTTKGFLPPRMTTTQRDAISSPASGLIIYNTTTGKLNVRGAAAWEAITSV